MSGNNVKITESGPGLRVMCADGLRPHMLGRREVAALREYFAAERKGDYFEGFEEGVKVGRAERMPEDVKALVDEARRIGSQFEGLIGHYAEYRPLIRALAAALEAAYSQKGAEPEWEYRTLINGGDPFIHRPLTVGSISVAEWFSHDDPRTASGELTLERRRVAGPWEPVEKGAVDEPR
jgi:hypothetical protein